MGSCLCFCPEMIQWCDHSEIFIRTLGHCKKDDASNMSLNVAAGRCNCLLQYKRTQQQQMSPVFVVSLISSLNSKILNILESWSQSRCWSVVTHKTLTLSSIAVRSKHSRHVLILQVSHQTLKWRFYCEQVLQDVYKSILPAGAGILNMGELDAARRWDMVSPNYPCCMLISAGVERPSGGKWSELQNKRKAMKLVIRWGAAKWRHLLKPHSVRVIRTTSSGWRRSSPWRARHQCISDRDLSHFINTSSVVLSLAKWRPSMNDNTVWSRAVNYTPNSSGLRWICCPNVLSAVQRAHIYCGVLPKQCPRTHWSGHILIQTKTNKTIFAGETWVPWICTTVQKECWHPPADGNRQWIDHWSLKMTWNTVVITTYIEAREEPCALRPDRGEKSKARGLLNIYLTRLMVDWKQSGLKLANDIKAVNYNRANRSDELVTTSCTTARLPEDEL